MAKGTPATVVLEKAGVAFKLHEYDYDPNAERIGRETLTLPLFPAMQLADVDRVVAAVNDIVRGAHR